MLSKEASLLADAIPLWLERETDYAVSKYGDSNPQRTALDGGLIVGGSAFRDITQYYHRFSVFLTQSEGDRAVLLRASQMFGKYVNASKALLNVLIQTADGPVDRNGLVLTDDRTDAVVGDLLVVTKFTDLPDLGTYFQAEVKPGLVSMADSIEAGDYDLAYESARGFLQRQMSMAVNVANVIGFVAQPGISSSDEDGMLDVWAA